MPRIAVFGGTGYLASLIKNQNNIKKNKYTFFSRKKDSKNHINFLSLKKNLDILKNFDFIVHLAGPNQDQFKRNNKLIEKKMK
jgi:NAD dependent epimerase/dehydratase family enzyme